ncbi:YceI family protein [Sphingomonas sp.]|jgi:polyisoprenoid-binding protein YceI|uniref:YceI family protein n=1 Tax=Sphingomonas sp. TaxID=28214 RepID=UPI002D804342|nr:YceI family protein [Sphingomonas sp.]HEU0043665.1 YceI family protein [Sphingomonas sp.]
MRPLLLAALLVAAATPHPLGAQGAPAKPGAKDPARVTGGTYTVDPGHTLITWTVDHLGFSSYSGIFGDVTGTLVLDPRNLTTAKVDITIPVSKVTTASSGLTSHLLRAGKDGGKADFFGANPADARFVSTRVVARGQAATITGNLTLNGVTRPVTLAATFYGAGKAPAMMGGKENVGFNATATILRSQFGVGYGIPMVSDAVKLDIQAAFQK